MKQSCPQLARVARAPLPCHVAAENDGAETLLWRGRELLLRPIGSDDDAGHTAFFARVAPDDLRLRFFSNRRGVPHEEIVRLVHPDAATEVSLIALAQPIDGAPEEAPEELATARAVAGTDNLEAEIGITVRSDLKGQGLGEIMLTKLIDRVRGRGTQRIVCEILHENVPMRALATRLGFQIEKRIPEQGSLRYVLELQPAKELPTC